MEKQRTFDPVSITLYTFLGIGLIFMASPLIFVVINSFNAAAYSPWPPEGFSLQWYREVIEYEPFRRGLRNTLFASVTATVLSLIIGSMAAYSLVRYNFWGRNLVHALFFSPLVVPRVAIGLAMFILFISVYSGFYGTVQSIGMAHTVLVLPFVITIFAANLAGINPVLEEAAQDLGATSFQTFWKVTLPQMKIGFVIAGLFAFNTSFDEVEMSIFLVRPASNTLPIEMFLYLEQRQTPALAALSTFMIGVGLALVLIALPILRNQDLRKYAGRR